MGEGEVIEAIGFVILFLEFLELAPLLHALLHILSVLLLHGCFLLDFNLVQLVDLLTDSLVLQALLLKIVYSLFGFGLSSCLGLLHVLLHVFSGVLIGGLIQEEGPLAPVQFLLQKRLKCHLGQKFVILKRLYHFLLHLACIHRTVPLPSCCIVRICHRELTIDFCRVHSKISFVQRGSQVILVRLEAFALVPLP